MSADPAPRPQQALALRHDRAAEGPPRVVAKGSGELAERILAIAREYGVPVREDPELVELLTLCDVGDEVPVEVFGVVARLFACLYRWNAEGAPGTPPGAPTGT